MVLSIAGLVVLPGKPRKRVIYNNTSPSSKNLFQVMCFTNLLVRFLNKKNMLGRGLVVNYFWSRRNAIFSKKEHLPQTGRRSIFRMCIWCRRDARWKVQFFGKVCFTQTGRHVTECICNCCLEITILDGPDGAIRFPNMCLDAIFTKNQHQV